MKTTPMQLQFYTKSDCPLCDEAKRVLQSIEAKLSFITVEEVDITKNLGLFTKYKHLIPVLELDGQQLFVHRATHWKLVWQLRWHRFWRFIPQIGRWGL
ncbi:MAG: glutaredoxin family protein [Candidatus Poribacteria bacterium]|nr:glutaredoxin family protein [Candidatus Poribacteria bacterium]